MIGLGYIGLPTAALIANNKVKVHGVDINQSVVDTINEGKIHIVEPSLDVAVAKAVKEGYLKASTTPVEASTYIIVVPTPFKGKNEPDISFVESATRAFAPPIYKVEIASTTGLSSCSVPEPIKEQPYRLPASIF